VRRCSRDVVRGLCEGEDAVSFVDNLIYNLLPPQSVQDLVGCTQKAPAN
jgi:hypothetical protein